MRRITETVNEIRGNRVAGGMKFCKNFEITPKTLKSLRQIGICETSFELGSAIHSDPLPF